MGIRIRTGRIGRSNYQDLEFAIRQGHTADVLGRMFDADPETIRKYARKRGLTIQRVEQSMDKHPSWKGGETVSKGYRMIRVPKDGEFGYLVRRQRERDPHGYAPAHRVEMHRKLGRKLLPTEVVHHIDGDPLNNDPANLQLFQTNAAHLSETLKGQRPNWSDEGKERIVAAVRKQRRGWKETDVRRQPNRSPTRTDDQA